jgi:RNA polymerase sigma-70 factor (ECF subfamily)
MQDLVVEESPIQRLVELARQGDRAAFDEIVKRLRSRLEQSIERWARFRLGPRVDVEDVLQETFLRAYRSLDRFKSPEAFDEELLFRWISGVAKHALGDLLRKAAHREVPAPCIEQVSSETSQSRAGRREERFDRLQKALDALPPDYRQVLVLSRLEGLPAQEIARRIGRTPNAVYHLLVRALQLLREQFGDTESLSLPDRPLRRERGDDDERGSKDE